MEKINVLKASIVAVFAGFSAWLGWLGWLTVLFVISLTADWITGSVAAARNGEWQSRVAREGLWHKTGSIIAVLVAVILDVVIATVVNNVPGITLPFVYTVLLCPIVMIRYILTELGSIVENVGKMGAPVPAFLQKLILLFKGTVESTGENIINNK